MFITLLFLFSQLLNNNLQSEFKAKTEFISSEIGGRTAGSPKDSLMQSYLVQEFEKMGLNPKKQFIGILNQSDISKVYINSSNIIATVDGKDTTKAIVIGAHHDTVSDDVPGANDNTTGIVVLLELAKHYTIHQPDVSIHFVAFAAEENGLYGSWYYMSQYKNKASLKAMLNLDMIGRGDIVLGSTGDGISQWNVDFVKKAMNDLSLTNINLENTYLSGAKLFGGNNSDYVPFYYSGIPIISFSSRVIPGHYHTTEDTDEYIEYSNLVNVYDLSKNVIEQIINSEQLNTSKNYFILHIPGLDVDFVISTSYLLIVLIYFVFFFILQAKKVQGYTKKWSDLGTIKYYLIPYVIFIITFVSVLFFMKILSENEHYWQNDINLIVLTVASFSVLVSYFANNGIKNYMRNAIPSAYIFYILSSCIFVLPFLFTTLSIVFYVLLVLLVLNQTFVVKSFIVKLALWGFAVTLFQNIMSPSQLTYLTNDAHMSFSFFSTFIILFVIGLPFYTSVYAIFSRVLLPLNIQRIIVGTLLFLIILMGSIISKKDLYIPSNKPLQTVFTSLEKKQNESSKLKLYSIDSLLTAIVENNGYEVESMNDDIVLLNGSENTFPLKIIKKVDLLSSNDSSKTIQVNLIAIFDEKMTNTVFKYGIYDVENGDFIRLVKQNTKILSSKKFDDDVTVSIPLDAKLGVKVSTVTNKNIYGLKPKTEKVVLSVQNRITSSEVVH